jgi:electron transfer flavoprotein alpha subunit
MTDRGTICVFSENREVALELLAAGRPLADQAQTDLFSIVLEKGASGSTASDAVVEEQIAVGADGVLLVEDVPDDAGAAFDVEALQRVVDLREPSVLLVGGTVHGTEVVARLAQRLHAGCATDCTSLTLRDSRLEIERVTLGRFTCRQTLRTRPALASVRPRQFTPPERKGKRHGDVERLRVEAPVDPVRILERRERVASHERIDRAACVVAVGRGLRAAQDLPMIEALAQALDAAVGASRPLTNDLEWLPIDVKVGLSGTTVRPSLYIACGISGQIEHLVGMRESEVVVAINTDSTAPIMAEADYRVIGDLYELVPALTRALQELRP